MYKVKYLTISGNKEEDLNFSNILQNEAVVDTRLLPNFLKVIVATYSFNGYYLTCWKDGQLAGIASFYVKRGLCNRNFLESAPGGFWAKDINAELSLLEELNKIAEVYKLEGPCFKDLVKPLFSLPNTAIIHEAVINLPRNQTQLMNSYSSNLRRKIRKGRSSSLQVIESNDLKGFYNIWAHNMRDLGTPPIPFLFFQNIKKFFGDSAVLLLVVRGEEKLGGALLLIYEKTVLNSYISCLRHACRFYPNNLLYHEMLLWAINHNFTNFNLGRSQPASGNEKFKLQYGAELKPLYNYNIKTNYVNSLLGRIFKFHWKKLPLRTAICVGSKIRRYVPFG